MSLAKASRPPRSIWRWLLAHPFDWLLILALAFYHLGEIAPSEASAR